MLGIPPTRAETGYGYIEAGAVSPKGLRQVRHFAEKPSADVAEQFVKAGNFFWNSGMFVWSAQHANQRLDRASAQDGGAPEENRGQLWYPQVRENLC